MNCRRTNILLSAYLDGELTGTEMLAVRQHLDACSVCSGEHESLLATKRLVSSLMYKAPRADLESLLLTDQRRTNRGTLGGVFDMFTEWSNIELLPGSVLRPRPLAATILLSVAGFYLASTALNAPGDGFAESDHTSTVFPAFVSQVSYITPVALTSAEPASPPVTEVTRWVEFGPNHTSYIRVSQESPQPPPNSVIVITSNWQGSNTGVPISVPSSEIGLASFATMNGMSLPIFNSRRANGMSVASQ